MWQQIQTTCNKKFILNNHTEQNISKHIHMLHQLYRDQMACALL